ncbi:BglG family transcription antiterminator [Brevibacillus migulae]|uniref:BglG family transcription antiterminator n=1 Tax=Brevibacillus migulae TaxID=1644114 RepID=UPI00106DE9E3|nr:BglG family transcription antiterminator [Brevibacillus migulae]
MLTLRQQKILQLLMQMDRQISGQEMANHYDITPRTVRTDIRELSDTLSKHGAHIHADRRKGYSLHLTDPPAFRHFLQIITAHNSARHDIPDDPKLRVGYLMKRLLLAESYVKLKTLSDELFISESTIKNDLKEVRAVLSKYELRLEKRPNYGLKIAGEEHKLRYCMAEYVFARNEDHSSMWNEEQLAMIRGTIQQHAKAAAIPLSEIGLNNLVIHLAIACKRILDKNVVSMTTEDLQHIRKQAEYSAAANIVEALQQGLQLNFPEEEIAYVTIHLMGSKKVAYQHANGGQLTTVIDPNIMELTQKLLADVENQLHLGIQHDRELIMGLSLHLKPALNRYHYGMNIRNPLLPEIKQRYPIAFEAGILMGKSMYDSLNIQMDEDEIGHLALHVGAAIERAQTRTHAKRCLIVCATGVASAQLIYYKLQATFGTRLEIVGTTSLLELHEYPLEALDFIISTIPIQNALPVPVVDVNTILGDQDISKIRMVLNEGREKTLQFIQPELAFFKQDCRSQEEVIDFLVEKIQPLGMIPDDFKELLLEREAVSPTSFGNLVAIPHPIRPVTDHTFWSICTLNKPILWGHDRVQLICLLSVQRKKKNELQALYNFLVKMVDDAALVNQLLRLESYEELTHVLQHHG